MSEYFNKNNTSRSVHPIVVMDCMTLHCATCNQALIQMYTHTFVFNEQLTCFLCKMIDHKAVFLPVLDVDQ